MYKLTTDDAEGQTPETTQTLDELGREGARRTIAAALDAAIITGRCGCPMLLLRKAI
jgi:hypothetical protein